MSATVRRYLESGSDIAPILAQWGAERPDARLLALVAESDAALVAELQRQSVAAGMPLAGAIFPELIVGGRFVHKGVWLLALPTGPAPLLLPCVAAAADAAQLSAALQPQMRDPMFVDGESTLLLLFDALVPHIASLLEELYLLLADRVHYMGGNGGSESFTPLPCLFDQTQLIGNGVLALLLPGDMGALLGHGYRPAPDALLATSTSGNSIRSIGCQPAFEVYRNLARTHYGAEITAENFYQFGTHFPVGLMRADGEAIVRIPVALDESGALHCVGEVPANTLLTVLEAPQAGLRQAVGEMGTTMQGYGWRFPFTLYCAGRRLHLGIPSAESELAYLGLWVGPIDGVLSLGEIGHMREGDAPVFQNGTLVCCSWGG